MMLSVAGGNLVDFSCSPFRRIKRFMFTFSCFPHAHPWLKGHFVSLLKLSLYVSVETTKSESKSEYSNANCPRGWSVVGRNLKPSDITTVCKYSFAYSLFISNWWVVILNSRLYQKIVWIPLNYVTLGK